MKWEEVEVRNIVDMIGLDSFLKVLKGVLQLFEMIIGDCSVGVKYRSIGFKGQTVTKQRQTGGIVALAIHLCWFLEEIDDFGLAHQYAL